MTWLQHYDPLGHAGLSTVVAALPVVVLLGGIALLRLRIYLAALLGLAVALAVAVFAYRMPVTTAGAATLLGALFGLFPIGWIVLNLIFLYTLTVERGLFDQLRGSLARVTPDPRVQVILIAFSFGAFFEGAAGFGTPVAVTSAILISLGFKPLEACGLSLIANTAPVAYGSLGTPIIALHTVTGLDLHQLSAMVGRQLPFFSVLVPFWIVWAMAGFRGVRAVWPAALTAGVAFAVPQFLISNFHGPWLVDVVGSMASMGALVTLLRFWQPHDTPRPTAPTTAPPPFAAPPPDARAPAHPADRPTWRAWVPWLILTACLFLWGLPQVKALLNGLSAPKLPMPALHQLVQRVPPVVAAAKAEDAVFTFNWLSATGTAILLGALVAGCWMRFTPHELCRLYGRTIVKVRFSLLTIAAMLALGYVTRYSGADATLGLALATTGSFYPFCGTILGWLGVALTGSDTASNVLFGSLQRITAEKTGLSPVLMAAANSSGGVMGKMVDAQSIVVASTATNWYGHEGAILRYVFFHSVALAALMGLLVTLQARVAPFTSMVVK